MDAHFYMKFEIILKTEVLLKIDRKIRCGTPETTFFDKSRFRKDF